MGYLRIGYRVPRIDFMRGTVGCNFHIHIHSEAADRAIFVLYKVDRIRYYV